MDEQRLRKLSGVSLTEAKEELVFSRTAWNGEGEKIDTSKDIRDLKLKVGGKFVTWAAAPGSGKAVYAITKIDQKGVWGKLESNTIRAESLNEGLSSQQTRELKEIFSRMAPGDFKNLQNAYFKGAEGTTEYYRLLYRLSEEIPRLSPVEKILKDEIKAAADARRSFNKTNFGKIL
jgi:hypothetical protein